MDLIYKSTDFGHLDVKIHTYISKALLLGVSSRSKVTQSLHHSGY